MASGRWYLALSERVVGGGVLVQTSATELFALLFALQELHPVNPRSSNFQA